MTPLPAPWPIAHDGRPHPSPRPPAPFRVGVGARQEGIAR